MRRAMLCVMVAVLAGCGGSGVGATGGEAANRACDELAAGYGSAETPEQRADLAERINESASQSDIDRIREFGAELIENAEGPDTTWELSADLFADTCFDEGWDG